MSAFTFCHVCKLNHGLGRKHNYTKRHQAKVLAILEKAKARVDEIKLFLENVYERKRPKDGERLEEAEFWCPFCRESVKDVGDIIGADIVHHIGSKTHRKNLFEFCRKFNADPTQTLRGKLLFSAPQIYHFENKCTAIRKQIERNRDAEQSIQKFQSNTSEATEEFLSSVASTLQTRNQTRQLEDEKKSPAYHATHTNQLNTTSEPLMAPPTADPYSHKGKGPKCATKVSVEGILQNPLGTHNGKRVWGGGIIPLRKNQWVAWPIDVLEERWHKEMNSIPGEQGVEEEDDHGGIAGQQQRNTCTEFAYGTGLSSIKRIEVDPSEGNVHTGGIPPWLRDVHPQSSALVQAQCSTAHDREPEKNRVLRSMKLQSASAPGRKSVKNEANDNWLPNFGGVWQHGPRATTKRSFLHKMKREVPKGIIPSVREKMIPRVEPGRDVPTTPRGEIPDAQHPGSEKSNGPSNHVDWMEKKRMLEEKKEKLRLKMRQRRPNPSQ